MTTAKRDLRVATVWQNTNTVRILTFGGLNGYDSGTLISNENFPPSYGVSGGPAISPFNSV